MVNLSIAPTSNKLLASLSKLDRALLAPHLHIVPIKLNHVFEKAHEPILDVYFLESGLASIVAGMEDSRKMEIGLTGREGMTGSSLFTGDDQSPFDCLARMEGRSLRISSKLLMEVVSKSPSLLLSFRKYARALSIQTSYAALVNGQASIEQRLARLLLVVHDRIDGDSLSVTHVLLALMLGVRRSGVTNLLNKLARNNLIVLTRGVVVILDRDGLIEAAGGAYGPGEREYLRLTGVALSKSPRAV